MKKNILIACGLTALLSVSCQKEEDIGVFFPSTATLQPDNRIHLTYMVDEITYSTILDNADNLHQLIVSLTTLCTQGHHIAIWHTGTALTISSKDKQTIDTKDKDNLLSWIEKMSSEGYTVTYTFDEKTGYYHGTAVK